MAATRTVLATEPFEISELAASLSSVLNYLQGEKNVLLFGHPGCVDPEYLRRFSEDPAHAQEPKDPNWRPFQKECETAVAGASIPEGRTSDERAVSRLHQRRIAKPIIRRRLLDPANARERSEVLGKENTAIENVTRIDVSPGMRDAMLLQLDYIDGNAANLKQDLDLFFKTRGRTVRVGLKSFKDSLSDAPYVVIMDRGDVAGVVLGYAAIDGERFALVFFPGTGRPLITTLAQRDRLSRVRNGLPTEEPNLLDDPAFKESMNRLKESESRLREFYRQKGLPAPVPDESIEERARKAIDRQRTFAEKMPYVEDPQSGTAMSVEGGVHLIRYSCLESWQAVLIEEIGVGDNWGRMPSNVEPPGSGINLRFCAFMARPGGSSARFTREILRVMIVRLPPSCHWPQAALIGTVPISRDSPYQAAIKPW